MRDHRIQVLLCVLLLTMSVAMTACVNAEDANAQLAVPRVVETFVMDPGSFFMDADQAPTVVAGDQFTQYTMTGSTIIRFNLATGVLFTRVLQTDEVVIERPASVAGFVTIIHRRGI